MAEGVERMPESSEIRIVLRVIHPESNTYKESEFTGRYNEFYLSSVNRDQEMRLFVTVGDQTVQLHFKR